MTYDDLRALVPAPDKGTDWAQCCDLLPALLRLEETPQDPYYHAEGNVGIHTRMVLDALMQDARYQRADADGRFVLFMACLLHVIAKPDTTVIDEASGRVGQPGHSRRGAVDVRVLMWKARVPFALREAVCRIIAVHQVPFHAFASRKGVRPEVAGAQALLGAGPARPVLRGALRHARPPLREARGQHGRHRALRGAGTGRRLLGRPATNGRCPHAPGLLPRSRHNPDYPLFQTPGSRVTVMCGLPASGKNHWAARHRKGWPVVSFDDARAELGLKHGENDGLAAHHAVDQAKALLRKQERFVWNATHLSQQMRTKTLDLLWAYHAQIELVYVEAPHAELMRRNRERDTTLSNAGIERMLHRWELPAPTEAHETVYEVQT